jgi:ectoine hydroxylase-related dioxygenase (phytanoyl-CoA dioxygenase family)
MLVEESYVRAKDNTAGTPIHADFFYFLRDTDVLHHINNRVTTPRDMCHICKTVRGHLYGICGPCIAGYIPVFTAWISLGTYQHDTHALLEILPASHLLTGYDSPVGEVPATTFGHNWVYPSQTVQNGNMVIFNCKTLHRARPPTVSGHRMSIDVRFIILQ